MDLLRQLEGWGTLIGVLLAIPLFMLIFGVDIMLNNIFLILGSVFVLFLAYRNIQGDRSYSKNFLVKFIVCSFSVFLSLLIISKSQIQEVISVVLLSGLIITFITFITSKKQFNIKFFLLDFIVFSFTFWILRYYLFSFIQINNILIRVFLIGLAITIVHDFIKKLKLIKK